MDTRTGKTHKYFIKKNAKIIPFLMNFSSEESWATRMSISPIIFLIGVHSHGTPDKAKMQAGYNTVVLICSHIPPNVSNPAIISLTN